jgi:hypothetical protein
MRITLKKVARRIWLNIAKISRRTITDFRPMVVDTASARTFIANF